MPSVNQQISTIFYNKAKLLENKGEKYKFRVISYLKAAQAVAELEVGVDEIYKRSWLVGLQKIKGIGNRLAHDIENELNKLKIINKPVHNKINK